MFLSASFHDIRIDKGGSLREKYKEDKDFYKRRPIIVTYFLKGKVEGAEVLKD